MSPGTLKTAPSHSAAVAPGTGLALPPVYAVYLLLLLGDALRFFPAQPPPAPAQVAAWLHFSFSVLVGVLYLVVGSLVLLYARSRAVALLLFCFCAAMACSFAVQTGAELNDRLLSALGDAASALALALFAILLLLFPHNALAASPAAPPGGAGGGGTRGRLPGRTRLVRAWVGVLGGLCLLAAGAGMLAYVPGLALPGWSRLLYYGYYLLALLSIGLSIGLAYRRCASLRARQQLRLFVLGVLLSFGPLLLLTVLPDVLSLPPQFVLNGEFSALSLVLLPLALGYSILRYQILVFDHYIRRIVTWIAGCVVLGACGYIVVALSSILLSTGRVTPFTCVVLAVLATAVLGPYVWHWARKLTERIFFREMLHYRRVIEEQPELLSRATVSLNQAAGLLTQAAMNAFGTQEVCLLVLDAEGSDGHYRPTPEFSAEEPLDTPRQIPLQQLRRAGKVLPTPQPDWLRRDEPLLGRVAAAGRPLLLSEAGRVDEALPKGLARYLAFTSPLVGPDPLLAPLWAQGKLIGLLLLGERGDGQVYAGPDFEAIDLMAARFGPVLEMARANAQLLRAFDQLQDLDRLKDQFIMTASHELRTPLTAVQGYIELLSAHRGQLSEEQQVHFFQNAERACEELTLLLGNIMEAGRVAFDVEHVTLDPAALDDLVARVLEILEAQTRREKRTVRLDIPPHLQILVDGSRLQQVVLNLMTNALKYSPVGSPIEITCEVAQAEVTVRIRDHGLGVPPDTQGIVFERFVRLERDLNSPVRGTGLGLFLCKQLVVAMGGRIWVESTGVVGEGSCFCFALPLRGPSSQPTPTGETDNYQFSN